MSAVRMHIDEAEALVAQYDIAERHMSNALTDLSPLIAEARSLLEQPAQSPMYGPVPALQTTINDLRSDSEDLAWRIALIVEHDNTQLDLLELATLNEQIANWSGTDNDPLFDELVRERQQLLLKQSVLGTAEALGVPIDYAAMLVDALNVAPGEIVVGFGGLDVNRPDIRELIESSPAEFQFEGFNNALLSTAVTESQLANLQASENSAARGYNAWANGERIDTNDLAAHNLELQTGGVEGYGTWYVIRNEQGIAIAAWYDAPPHLNAFDNMTLAESTAAFRRGLALATEQDETYQSLLDSSEHGETNAAAFTYALTGDETLAEDVRLGAWPGNYTGVVSESAVTDPHIWLDGIGLVPVVGEAADLANAGLYLIEGEYADAAISTAATLPFLGNLAPARRVANRLGGEVIDSAQTAQGQIIHTIRKADGTTAQIVELADGQIIQGPSTLVQRNSARIGLEAWSLPSAGGAHINGRWYTEHSLERMAPATPANLAILERRAIQRAKREGIETGTDVFADWWKDNHPNPRNIPPMVVEAEILSPGSTNIKVITNSTGDVVTVIFR